MGIGKIFMVGLKLWLILLLSALVMAIPYGIYMFTVATMPMVGLLIGLVVLLLEFVAMGWFVIKFKRFIFGR